MRLIPGIVLFSLLPFLDASHPKVYAKMHVKEELSKDYVIAEASQLVTKSRDSRTSPVYKLISPKLRSLTLNHANSAVKDFKWLQIDRKTGTLRFKRPFDRDSECPGCLECTIHAQVIVMPRDIFQIIELEIVIEDVNDNRPVFPLQTLVLNISESLSAGATINLDAYQATDKDIGRNGHLRYSTSSNNYFRARHHVDEKNSSHLTLHVTQKPDREKMSEMELDLYARDAGSPVMVGEMKLKIKIIDTNDNFPKFEKDTYTATLEENAPAGTIVAEVKANDADEGLFGKIRYRISPKNRPSMLRLAQIDPVRGTVWLKEALDREKHRGLNILIDALDSDPGNPKIGETWLTINVEDVNDNTPEIEVEFVSQSSGDIVYVSESAPNGSYIAKLSVRDTDGGENGETYVTLTSSAVTSRRGDSKKERAKGYFSLSDDGFLVNSLSFDREVCSRYRVQIKACDNGIPQRCSKKEITVVILDENEFSPTIEETLQYVNLREDIYLGSEITTIVANDGDSANGYALTRNETGGIVTSHNGDVTFSITEGGFGVFSIGKDSGVIRLVSPLDREKKAEMKLTVSARDGGYPPRESFCTILITVKDVNDNSPIFLNPSNNITEIYADITSNKVITRIKAKDFDAVDNGRVSYHIVRHTATTEEGTHTYHGDKSANSTLIDSYFILNPVSGDLRLNFSKQNMSNAVGMHILKIRAKDSGKPSLSTEVSLRVGVVEHGNSHIVMRESDVSSSSIDFLVLAISLGCITAFLVFLIIGVVIRCRRMNREINSMSKTACRITPDEQSSEASNNVVTKSYVTQKTDQISEADKPKDGGNAPGSSSGKRLQEAFQSLSNVQLPLDVASMPHINDTDSGKGESDIEAASLFVNESKVYHQLKELGGKCTEKCRLYGHSDECWMPEEDGATSPNNLRLKSPNSLKYYDWERLKPRYYTPEQENRIRKESRYSYASTSNTDGSFAPSAATSHRSIQEAAIDDNRLYRPRYHSASSAIQQYPTVPLKYTAPDVGQQQGFPSSHYVDAVYEVNYSLQATGLCHSSGYMRSRTPAIGVVNSQYFSYNVPNQYTPGNISSSSSAHFQPTAFPNEQKVTTQEAREVFEGIHSLVV